MHEPFEITSVPTAEKGGVWVLRLTGAIDAKGVRKLADAVQLFKTTGRPVVLNLAGVNFIASSGVGVLLTLSEDFRDQGTALHIAEPSSTVRLAIELLNLEQYLNLHASESEALKAAA
jgi:anti-anti-sigma factor